MKTKLFKNIGYLLFILLSLNSCVNEMDMIEDELDLETNNAQLYPSGTWTKNLINYESSTKDKNALFKVETLLKNIYDFVPDMRYVIDNLIMRGLKFCVSVSDNSGSSVESWYDPSYPPEIGFNGDGNIRIERLLHELLHLFSFNTYDLYRAGTALACEEYEIRVLTDLFMRRYFRDYRYTYQGMHPENNSYRPYLAWLDEILYDSNYSIDYFKLKFKEYGFYCIGELNESKLNTSDFNSYIPQLVMTMWFYNKN